MFSLLVNLKDNEKIFLREIRSLSKIVQTSAKKSKTDKIKLQIRQIRLKVRGKRNANCGYHGNLKIRFSK